MGHKVSGIEPTPEEQCVGVMLNIYFHDAEQMSNPIETIFQALNSRRIRKPSLVTAEAPRSVENGMSR